MRSYPGPTSSTLKIAQPVDIHVLYKRTRGFLRDTIFPLWVCRGVNACLQEVQQANSRYSQKQFAFQEKGSVLCIALQYFHPKQLYPRGSSLTEYIDATGRGCEGDTAGLSHVRPNNVGMHLACCRLSLQVSIPRDQLTSACSVLSRVREMKAQGAHAVGQSPVCSVGRTMSFYGKSGDTTTPRGRTLVLANELSGIRNNNSEWRCCLRGKP